MANENITPDSLQETSYQAGDGIFVFRGNEFRRVDPATLPNTGADTLASSLAASTGSSLVGFLQYGTGAVARTVQEKLRETVSIADKATLADALAAVPAEGGRLVATPGTISVTTNTTIPKNVCLEAQAGAVFSIAAGVTLTVLGEISAGNFEIFDGAGTVDLDNSSGEYNLAWFKTTNGYINERWDFAKRGMLSFRTKVVRFPKPREGQAGVLKSGNRLFWLFSAPITFTDAQNAATIYVEAEFSAANDCASFMLFDDAAKPENIYFYGPIQAAASSMQNVPIGIDVRAGSRISFFGNVVLNGFKTTVSLGGTSQSAGVEDIYMPRTQFSFFSVAALDIYGKSTSSVQNIKIGNLRVTAAQTTGLPVARLRGVLRDIDIESIYYATDTAKDGYTANDAEDVVLIESNAEGTINHVNIGAIYQANANNGVRTQSAVSDASKINDVTVGRIYGKSSGSAANIDYATRVTINGVENRSDVTLGTNAVYCRVTAGQGLRTFTDTGSYNLLNNLGKQARGAGLPPAPSVNWPIGCMVRETGDNRVYLRIAAAGAATDFLMVRGTMRGTTASRPTLTTTDVGVLYLDTTLVAAGKPIWWTGTAWVDATGATV